MKERILDDLIDDWLKHKISEEDRVRMERMMEADPVIATHMQESREAYQFLQYLKYKEIRNRLREHDKIESAKLSKKYSQRWKLVSFILLAFFAGSWIWLIDYYNPVSLAKRNFISFPEKKFATNQNFQQQILIWNEATKYFQQNDFRIAAELFHFFDDHPESSHYQYSKWNELMCHLAIEGPTAERDEELNQFLSIAPGPIKTKAIRLSRLLNSAFYKWAILKPSSQFSALKPRLI